jgi:peptidoglycan/LPS O-acetylase OafA/YrhL
MTTRTGEENLELAYLLSPTSKSGDGPFQPPDVHLSPPDSHHITIADAMRATAILLVVVNHLFVFSHPIIGHRAIRLGYLGAWAVNTFFLLSGFLLGRDYIRAILDGRGFPNTGRFLARRFLRIYPLYAVAIVVSVILVISLLRPVSPAVIIEHVFMLQGAIETTVFALNAPLWTMGIDAAFYLMLPIFMGALFVATRTLSRRKKITLLGAALAGVVILSIAYRYYQSSHAVAELSSFPALVVNVRTIFGMATAFALGIAIALVLQVVPRARFASGFYAALVGLGAIIAVAELFARLEETKGHDTLGYLKLTFLDPIAAVSSALILYGLLQGGVPLISRLARIPLMGIAAGLAYAVYLFHYPILEAFDSRVLHGVGGVKSLLELALCCLLVVLPTAVVTHRFIENPCMKLKNRLRNPTRVRPREIVLE